MTLANLNAPLLRGPKMSFPAQNDLVRALNRCKPSHVIENGVSKTLRGSAVW
jgi:hypothetical protein